MNRSLLAFLLTGVLILSIWGPRPIVRAQSLSFPAEMNKSFSPISIEAGGTSRLSVTIYNPNSFELTGATWNDDLIGVQPGLIIANPVNLENTCGGTATAEVGGTSLSLNGGTVPAQVGTTPGSCTVSVDVTSTASGNMINTIPANGLSSTGNGNPITNTTPASATLHVSEVQAPAVSKRFEPTTILVGETSRFTIRIRNNDLLAALTQASLTDQLPDNLVLANPVSPTLDGCGTSAALAAGPGDSSFTLNNADIAPNTTCTIRVRVTATDSAVYTNTIPPGALQTEQGLSNGAAASATLNVQAIGLSKAFSPPNFQAGATTTLTITVQNPSSLAYTGATLSDTLPGSALTLVPGSASTTCGGTASINPPRTFTLSGGTIPAGTAANPGTCTISVQVTAPAGTSSATFTNRIPAGQLQTDQNVSNVVPATADVRVYQTGTGMRGNKSFNPATIQAGENSRLRISITAPADTNLTNFSLTDQLPPDVTVSNSSPAAASPGCGPAAVVNAATGASSISLTNGMIAAGATCQIDVFVTSSIGGVHTNTVRPGDITNAENRTVPNDLTADLTVETLTDLSISKAFTPPNVRPGGISTLTITLQNRNASPLVNASLTDTLPGTATNGIIVAPTPNARTTCADGVVTAQAGTRTISLRGATIPAQVGNVPGTCTITVDVQGMGAERTRTNTIPISNVSATIQGTTTTINPGAPASADLTIGNLLIGVVKGFDPLTVFGGSASTLSVELINPNKVPLTGITFTDHMPAGMILANPANPSVGNCGGTLTGDPGSDTFALSGASVQAGSRCVMTLRVTMTVNGNLTNVIPASSVTTLSGITNPDPAAATLTNLPGASVSKFFAPNPAAPGEPVQLTITIQNTGGVALSGMGFVDVLPAGLEILDSPAPVNNCGGTLSAPASSQTIQLAGGALAASSSCTVLVNVRGNQEGSYTNTLVPGTLTNQESATNRIPATDTLVITSTPGTTLAGQNQNSGQAGQQNQNTGQAGQQNQNTGQAGNPNPTQIPGTGGSIIPATGFAPGRITQLDTATAPHYEATTLTLAIPSLNVQAEILGVPEKDGGWDLSWLQDQVGWLNGTAFPTQRGNSLLTAHVVKADGQPGPFLNLKHLHIGEQVILSFGGYQYTYLVVSNTLLEPTDGSVFKPEKDSYITLITCDGYDEKTGTYLRRVAVQAKLIAVQMIP